jgi:hypothetical protein
LRQEIMSAEQLQLMSLPDLVRLAALLEAELNAKLANGS